MKHVREGAVVMSCGRLMYAVGLKMEKALAPYVFVACLGMTREGLAEEHSALAGLKGTRRAQM